MLDPARFDEPPHKAEALLDGLFLGDLATGAGPLTEDRQARGFVARKAEAFEFGYGQFMIRRG